MQKSEVAIMCEEKAYEMLKKAWEETGFKPDIILDVPRTDSPNDYIIRWKRVRWNTMFSEVQPLETVCRELCTDKYSSKEGYAFKKITIGEETSAITTEGNERGLDKLEICTEVVMYIPAKAKPLMEWKFVISHYETGTVFIDSTRCSNATYGSEKEALANANTYAKEHQLKGYLIRIYSRIVSSNNEWELYSRYGA